MLACAESGCESVSPRQLTAWSLSGMVRGSGYSGSAQSLMPLFTNAMHAPLPFCCTERTLKSRPEQNSPHIYLTNAVKRARVFLIHKRAPKHDMHACTWCSGP